MKTLFALVGSAAVVLLMALSLAGSAWAGPQQIDKKITHQIVTANIGANVRDTAYSDPLELLPKGENWLYQYRAWRLTELDTLFAADSVYIITQTAPTQNGPWTKFDSTKIIPTRTVDTLIDTTVVAEDTTIDTSFNYKVRDTTISFAVRLKLDSSAITSHAAFVRFMMVNGFSLGSNAADSAIVGRKYDVRLALYLNGRN